MTTDTQNFSNFCKSLKAELQPDEKIRNENVLNKSQLHIQNLI